MSAHIGRTASIGSPAHVASLEAELARLRAENAELRKDAERDDFLQGICVALQCVTASDDGVLWKEIVTTAGIDKLLHYAAIVEPDEWVLAGFAKYALAELRRRRPRADAAMKGGE